ncbi:hypothetical protein AKJ62_03050 [candidate division MSBL1 archaeon SCGC-AAA259D14]|uniref:Helix-hairpin-helix DNA-binding motif class 1 domain-containing protein n=1 Tax=candidate division MSBL1 archaeon SCGC-AAA259D14 TaxID=1698261 RepID=A0A133U5L7_9EURY|nr:hypothetical protein AKJ62_03050 [candidate division MSBL1 archaeon SCGC-AAA259D14]
MVSENMKSLAKAVRDGDVDRAGELVREMIREREGGVLEKFENLPGVDSDLAKTIQMHGYNTVDMLAKAPLEKLVKIPELREGKAEEVLEAAREHVEKKLTELPGVGGDTAREIVKNGYTSFEDLAKASVEELTEIPKVGRKGAEKIHRHAENKAVKDLEDLPGVGGETAMEMRKHGFTAMRSVSESSIEELSNIPNIGEEGAEDILEYAKDNPLGEIEDLPGVGKKTAKEIVKHGHTPVRLVASSTVEELAAVPNIGVRGAERILEYAREKSGGRIEELPGVDEDTAERIRDYGYPHIESVANASVQELVKIPGLREGKAKKVSKSAREIVQDVGESAQGYIQALEGIVSGLEPDRELTLPRKIAEGKCSREELEKIREQMERRASQEFRPTGERKYDEAWVEFLRALIETEEK